MIPLEHLADGSVSDRNFQKLMQLVIDTGGRSLGFRCGVAVVTFLGGSQTTDVLTVDHGLGRAPLGVLATVNRSGGLRAWGRTGSMGATTFPLVGETADAAPANGTTMDIFWVAVG